jgi:hypothetical protein
VLIFEWLGGVHVACLINFISLTAFSGSQQEQKQNEEKKYRIVLLAKKKKKEQNRTEQKRTLRSDRMASTVSIELPMYMPKKLLYDETEITPRMSYIIIFFFFL